MSIEPFTCLVKAAQQGDSAALAELMNLYQPLIRSVIGRVYQETALLSVRDSEQLVWTKVWLRLEGFLGHGDPEQCRNIFAGWISRIARHTAMDQLTKARAQVRGGNFNQADYAEAIVPDGGPSPSSKARVMSQANRLRAEIDKLDVLDAEVIRLRFYESMTIGGIADHTQLSVDKVRGIIDKTLGTLKVRVPE
jgi:RNA polymerase sigma factor (sigma-70 family)